MPRPPIKNKPCSQRVSPNCSGVTAFSVISVISSVGLKQRVQKTSKAVHVCTECFAVIAASGNSAMSESYRDAIETFTRRGIAIPANPYIEATDENKKLANLVFEVRGLPLKSAASALADQKWKKWREKRKRLIES